MVRTIRLTFRRPLSGTGGNPDSAGPQADAVRSLTSSFTPGPMVELMETFLM